MKISLTKSGEYTARIYLILSMVIFGTIGIFRRYIPLPSGALAMLRGIVGASALLLIMFIIKKPPNIKKLKSNLLLLIISGALIGFNWIFLFESYNYTSVATATLCYYMAPVFVLIASPIFLKEKLTVKQIICSITAIIGIVLVSGVFNQKYADNKNEFIVDDSDIKICIENSDGYEDFQKEAVELLLESNVFALTFDVGHNHGIGGTDEEFIMKHKDRLHHIHLHDAEGTKNHLALGTGEMDIEKYISLANEHNCRVVLETKTIDGLKQSVEWLKGYTK